MKLLKLEISNFGSYEHLEFNFENQGLSLIYGDTGAGKSTFLDAVKWVLSGNTAKNGNSDDIRRFGVEEISRGVLELYSDAGRKVYKITRTRGKPLQNDLYWTEGDSEEKRRGKDITETQKLLDETLRMDAETYNIAAYYHEYSITRNFFDANAKQRRELFESLADLSFPAKLVERIISAKRETKKAHTKLLEEFNQTVGRLEGARKSKADSERDAKRWSETQEKTIQEFTRKAESFDRDKEDKIASVFQQIAYWEEDKNQQLSILINSLDKIKINHMSVVFCPTCGSIDKETQEKEKKLRLLQQQIEKLSDKPNPYTQVLETLQLSINNNLELLSIEKNKLNPFLSQIDTINCDIERIELEVDDLRNELESLNHKLHSLDHLQDMSSIMRAELLRNVIKQVEYKTNLYLETYFDSEFRVEFNLNDSDDLDIIIQKNGHQCNFRQLSKGQKCLLRLCFSVSAMKAASNKAGVHFDTLFFDEALDGLDETLKIKSFNLFSELEKEHSNILIIDHNASFHNLFFNKYCVMLDNDSSKIIKE